MGVKVSQWSQPVLLPHSPSSSQTPAFAISFLSSKQRSHVSNGGGGPLACRFVHKWDRLCLFHRSRSCDYTLCASKLIRRTCGASLDSFFDEEFSKNIDDSDVHNSDAIESFEPWLEVRRDLPDWHRGYENIPADFKRKANSVELPFSLRILKKKLQWKEGFREAGEPTYCSVKKAFSSMVFIIQEVHSYTLQMREILFYQDLQGILARVQTEMQASFVWLFQRVFSHTPTLMVHMMILLANFTVYSIGHNAAIAATAPPPTAMTEVAPASEIQNQKNQKFDSSSTIKTFSVSSSNGKANSIGGNNGGGGGKFRPVASGTDGDGGFDRSNLYHRTILPDGASLLSSLGTTEQEKSIRGENREEANLWNSMVEEARKIEGSCRDDALDKETTKRFVSSVSAKIESDDDYEEYLKTELAYLSGLTQEPHNPLLLANYAQFLCLVARDFDRAEEYFKRAMGVKEEEKEAGDAEAYNKYADFLWKVRRDLWGAEQAFLGAISAEPTNSSFAANYAHFLWNTDA